MHKFGCDLCFRNAPGEMGLSKRFKVFSRQAYVMIARKAPRFAAWRHEALVMWRPNWRFPKNSLAHSVLIRFTQGHSRYVKSPFTSPIKGDGPTLVKGSPFEKFTVEKELLVFSCWHLSFGFVSWAFGLSSIVCEKVASLSHNKHPH
jgi:hypothetical protein